VIETIDVTLDGSSLAVIRETEDRIVQPMMMAARSMDRRTRRKFYDEISSVIHRYVDQGIDVVYAETGHSIRCYLLCRSVVALRFLYISIENGIMKTAMQQVFGILEADNEGATVLRVTGRLNASELALRMTELRNTLGKLEVLRVNEHNFMLYKARKILNLLTYLLT